MELAFNIQVPDEIGTKLLEHWRDLPRSTLESLAADAYRQGVLTAYEVRRMLDLPSRLETQAFLKRMGAWLHYSDQEIVEDLASLRELTSSSDP